MSANEFEFCKAWWRAGTTLRANAENREFDPRVSANEFVLMCVPVLVLLSFVVG